ncbi:tRNA (guanine(10)-N2)-methyltransferase homolog [Patella vulgata]|uniref:tRNA (guanine(10)-N2)-methyltransferase homolog n=1 Tax=Patella vulgata TaxID=6465 RepID=UPI0024A9DB2A|nr:tRNA (guanine(10)-N2)-methyltransferase homolog [Patella vulgata]
MAASTKSKMQPVCNTCRKYLFHFASEHFEFKLAELKAIASLTKSEFKINEEDYDEKNPFLVVELPSEDHVHKLLSRSVLLRSVYELWAEGKTTEELNNNIRQLPSQFISPYLQADQSFGIRVESFNKKIPQNIKTEKIKALPFDVLDFQGKVDLNNAMNTFHLFEYYGYECSKPPEYPFHLYFGRWIAGGQRDRIQDLHLQKRHFIGNTSMDAGLSLIMSNMAKVTNNSLVLDPFVGTGSLLVAAAHHGGYVMGTELDFLLLHGQGKPSRYKQTKRASDESIRRNLEQYGTGSRYIDAIVGDSSKHDMWRPETYFDAIITDPPYGIREPAKKIGAASEQYIISEEVKDIHIPQKVQYQLSDIFRDLLNFAAKYLRLGGRLVFWFPVIRSDYLESNIPIHPSFQLIANCQQPLNSKVARRLITMEKIHNFQESSRDASVDQDHYEDRSFRQRYFHQQKEFPKNETKP